MEEYAHAANYGCKQPGNVYPFPCAEIRSRLNCEKFTECRKRERTYPYLTPLYIYYPVLTMAAGGRSGAAADTQTARFGGMTGGLPFVYENGNCCVRDRDEFAAGIFRNSI